MSTTSITCGSLTLGLFVESLVIRGPMTWLEVPAASFLLLGPDGSPSVVRGPPAHPSDAFRLEPVPFALKTHLLLVSPEGRSATVNGVPAPRVALLDIKDQVQFGSSHILHVSAFFRSNIGPPDPELVGQLGIVCQTPFKPDTLIYRCWSCNVPLHAEGAEHPAAARLECARMSSSCPRCGAAILWEEGFIYVPES